MRIDLHFLEIPTEVKARWLKATCTTSYFYNFHQIRLPIICSVCNILQTLQKLHTALLMRLFFSVIKKTNFNNETVQIFISMHHIVFLLLILIFQIRHHVNVKTLVKIKIHTSRVGTETWKEYYEDKYYHVIGNNNNTNILKLWNVEGELIFSKNISIWNRPLRKWNPEKEILTFIHVGKSAGNAFSQALRQGILIKNNCKMHCFSKLVHFKKTQPNCPYIRPIFCGIHFDWTIVQKARSLGHLVAPIIMLRNPVHRIVSHFYFLKHSPWAKGRKYQNQTLVEFFSDKESMMESHHLWNDGQVSSQERYKASIIINIL